MHILRVCLESSENCNILHSLHHFFFGHVQVTVADPLDLKPVSVAVVPTALELDLQQVHRALQEAAPWCVRVLVKPHGLGQPQVQRLLELPVHAVTHQGPHQHAEGEEEGAHGVGQHDHLPAQELGGVHAVVADLPTQEVDGAGDETHSYEHVGNILETPLSHQLPSLVDLHLEEDPQAEQDGPRDHGDPVEDPQHLGQLVPPGFGEPHF